MRNQIPSTSATDATQPLANEILVDVHTILPEAVKDRPTLTSGEVTTLKITVYRDINALELEELDGSWLTKPIFPSIPTLAIIADLTYQNNLHDIFPSPGRDQALSSYEKKLRKSFKSSKTDLDSSIVENYVNIRIQSLKTMRKEWQLLATAYNESDHYFGAAFWNATEQQLVISHRGTNPKDPKVLLADIDGVMRNWHILQIDSACTFVAHVLRQLSSLKRFKQVRISITGHSLGAWLAQITTFSAEYLTFDKETNKFKFTNAGVYHAHCVGFESPGCRPMLTKLWEMYKRRYEFPDYLSWTNLDITVGLTRPNLINECGKQVGKLIQIDITQFEEKDKGFIMRILSQLAWIRYLDNEYKYTMHYHSRENIATALTSVTQFEVIHDWPLLAFPQNASRGGSIPPKSKIGAGLKVAGNIPSVVCDVIKTDKQEVRDFKKRAKIENTDSPKPDEDIDYGITIHYCTDEEERVCHLNTFSKDERLFLNYWQKVNSLKLKTDIKDEIAKALLKLNPNLKLGQFEVPFADLSHDEEFYMKMGSQKIKFKYEFDVEKLVSFVKQLFRFFNNSEVFVRKFAQNTEAIVLICKEHSQSYLKRTTVDCLTFTDSINLEKSLNFEEQKVIFIKSKFKFEIQRIKNILCSDEGREKQFIFLDLNQIVDLECMNLPLLQKQNPTTFKSMKDHVLVLDCQQHKRLHEKDLELVDILLENITMLKSIIIVAHGELLENSFKHICETNFSFKVSNENFNWSDLTSDSQQSFKNLLKNREIVLQGKKIKLLGVIKDELFKDLDSDIVFKLINGEELKIGTEPTRFCESEAAYAKLTFPLSIDTNTLINAIKDEHKNELFIFISNAAHHAINCVKRLVSLLEIDEVDQHTNVIDADTLHLGDKIKILTSTNAEENEKVFKQCCSDNSKVKVYWLELLGDQFQLLQVYDPHFYESRTILHQEESRNLQDIVRNSKLVFSGTSAISKLLLGLENETERNSDVIIPNVFACLDENEARQMFEQWGSESQASSVHWFKVEDGHFILHKSQSPSTEPIINYVIKREETFFNEMNRDVVILAAEPGMGKSTTLTRLTECMLGTRWVIRLNLKDNKEELLKLPENKTQTDNVKSFVRFLLNVTRPPKESRALMGKLLECSLTHGVPRPLLILFDGYDEIDNDCRIKLMTLMKFLKNDTCAKFWVTSRLHYTLELEMNLGVCSTVFQELGNDERRKFLKSFWQIRLELGLSETQGVFGDNEGSKFRLFSDALFVQVNKVIDDKLSKFMGIPLQVRLLAEYFFSQFQKFITSGLVPDFMDISLTQIYRSFIDTKFNIYFKEKTILSVAMNKVLQKQFSDNWFKIHQRLAFYLLFPEEAKYLLKLQSPFSDEKFSIDSEVERELKLIGMVQSNTQGGAIEFIHRTFAEHFVATLLLDWLRKPIHSNKFDALESLLELIFQKFEVVCFFLNEQISETDVALSKTQCFSENIFQHLYERCNRNNVNLMKFILSFFNNKKWLLNNRQFSEHYSQVAEYFLELIINNYDLLRRNVIQPFYDIDSYVYKFKSNTDGVIYKTDEIENVKNFIIKIKWHSKIIEELVQNYYVEDLCELCADDQELCELMQRLKREDSAASGVSSKENEINRLMKGIRDKYEEDYCSKLRKAFDSFVEKYGDGRAASQRYYLKRFIDLISEVKPRKVIKDFQDFNKILENINTWGIIAGQLLLRNGAFQIQMPGNESTGLTADEQQSAMHDMAEILENETEVSQFFLRLKNDEEFSPLLELSKDLKNKEKEVEMKITYFNDDDAIKVINANVDIPKVFFCSNYYEDHLGSELQKELKAEDGMKFLFHGFQNESRDLISTVPSSIANRVESFLSRVECDEAKQLLSHYLPLLPIVDFIFKDDTIKEVIHLLVKRMEEKKIKTLRDVFDCVKQHPKMTCFAAVATEPTIIIINVEMLMEVLELLFTSEGVSFWETIGKEDTFYLERMLNYSKDFPGIFCLIIVKAFEPRRCTFFGDLPQKIVCLIYEFVRKYFPEIARCLAMSLYPFYTSHLSGAIQYNYTKVISLIFRILKPYQNILGRLSLDSVARHKSLLHFLILQSDVNTLEHFLTELNKNIYVMQYVIERSVSDEENKLNLYEAAVIQDTGSLLLFLNGLKLNEGMFESFVLPADVKPAFYLAGERGCKEVMDTLLSALKSEPVTLWQLLSWTDHDSGQTVLHRACDRGYPEIVDALLHSMRKQPVRLQTFFLLKDNSEHTALDCSILSERQIIRKNFNVDLRTNLIVKNEYKILKQQFGDFDDNYIKKQIDSLCKLSGDLMNMPLVVNLILIIAKSFNNVELMLAIFENEDLNPVLKEMYITLDMYSYQLFHCSIERNSLELVKLLIEKGIEVNATNGYGFTPLMRAVCNRKVDIAKLLLANGADIYAKDMNHKNAISYARKLKLNSEFMMKLFSNN